MPETRRAASRLGMRPGALLLVTLGLVACSKPRPEPAAPSGEGLAAHADVADAKPERPDAEALFAAGRTLDGTPFEGLLVCRASADPELDKTAGVRGARFRLSTTFTNAPDLDLVLHMPRRKQPVVRKGPDNEASAYFVFAGLRLEPGDTLRFELRDRETIRLDRLITRFALRYDESRPLDAEDGQSTLACRAAPEELVRTQGTRAQNELLRVRDALDEAERAGGASPELCREAEQALELFDLWLGTLDITALDVRTRVERRRSFLEGSATAPAL